MVYDYAVCGHTVQGVKTQVKDKFLEYAGKKPEYCPWESENALFSKPPTAPCCVARGVCVRMD